jgi:hypothetical protein
MEDEKLIFSELALRDSMRLIGQLAAKEHEDAKRALDDGYADSYQAATSRAADYLRAQAMIRHRIMQRQRDHAGPMPGVGGY